MIAIFVVFNSFCSYLFVCVTIRKFIVLYLLVEMKPVVADFWLADFSEKKVCKFWIPRT